MSERLRSSQNNERLLFRAEVISHSAVDLVAKKYGTGYPHTEMYAEEQDLAYHNMQHTMHVRDAAQYMVEALELNEHDAAIVRMAASAHDIVQGKPRGEMEQESALWLKNEMLRSGFSAEDGLVAELAILGTEPVIHKGIMTSQKVAQQDYPTERARLIALSVACADMAGLYAPYGPRMSRDLYKEMQGVSTYKEPTLEGLPAFQMVQHELLRTYRFPHPAGEELFAGLRQEVIGYQEYVTEGLSRGLIDKWSQLVAMDTEFCRVHL